MKMTNTENLEKQDAVYAVNNVIADWHANADQIENVRKFQNMRRALTAADFVFLILLVYAVLNRSPGQDLFPYVLLAVGGVLVVTPALNKCVNVENSTSEMLQTRFRENQPLLDWIGLRGITEEDLLHVKKLIEDDVIRPYEKHGNIRSLWREKYSVKQ